MATTYEKISRIIVGSGGVSNIEFTNIPQDYTDLKILFSARLSAADVDNIITLNTSTTASGRRRMYANGAGSTYSSDSVVGGGLANSSSYTADIFGSTDYYFPNYTSSINKTVSIDAVTETNGTNSYQNLSTQAFNLTSAITSIKLTPNSGTYVQYTTATLYGISKS